MIDIEGHMYVLSSIGNAYFSGVSFETVIGAAIEVGDDPELFDAAIQGSVFLQDVCRSHSERKKNAS